MIPGTLTTAGTFATEPDAWAHFDELVNANGAFAIHREVCGHYLHPRINTEDKNPRIDRLLIPKKAAIDSGWRLGAIAIEGKKSDTKVGKLIAQALDYSRCAWRLAESNPGLLVATQWTFVYPVERITGDIESIMAQNRIGYCMAYKRCVVFGCGGTNGLQLDDDGRLEIKPLFMGRKVGSR